MAENTVNTSTTLTANDDALIASAGNGNLVKSIDEIQEDAWKETKDMLRGQTNNLLTWRKVYYGLFAEKLGEQNDSLRYRSLVKKPSGTLTPSMIADILLETRNIISLNLASANDNEQDSAYMPAVYNPEKGIYELSESAFTKVIRIVCKSVSETTLKQVMFILNDAAPRRIQTGCDSKNHPEEKDYIPFRNGVLDRKTLTLMPYDPDKFVFVYRVECNWNPNAQDVQYTTKNGKTYTFESWLSEITEKPVTVDIDEDKADNPTYFPQAGTQFVPSPEDALLIKQIIGASMLPFVDFQESPWLYSPDGSSGKGTILDLIRELLGRHTSSLSLGDIDGDDSRFRLEGLVESGSHCILGDENDVGVYFENAKNFKRIVTHETINIDRKFRKGIDVKVYAFILQCFNNIAKMSDSTGSYLRRVKALQLYHHYDEKSKDTGIKNEWFKNPALLEYVCKACLMDIPYYDKFISTDNTREMRAALLKTNSPVARFAEEVLPQIPWSRMPIPVAYDFFRAWFTKTCGNSSKVCALPKFKTDLVLALKNNDEWKCDTRATFLLSKKYYMELQTKPCYPIAYYDMADYANTLQTSSRDMNKICLMTADRVDKHFEQRYSGGLWRIAAFNAPDGYATLDDKK